MATATLIHAHTTQTSTHNLDYWKAMHLLNMGESTPRLLMTAVSQHPCPELLREVASHQSATAEVLERVVSTVEVQLRDASTDVNKPLIGVLEAVIRNRCACTVGLAGKARTLIESIEQEKK